MLVHPRTGPSTSCHDLDCDRKYSSNIGLVIGDPRNSQSTSVGHPTKDRPVEAILALSSLPHRCCHRPRSVSQVSRCHRPVSQEAFPLMEHVRSHCGYSHLPGLLTCTPCRRHKELSCSVEVCAGSLNWASERLPQRAQYGALWFLQALR